MHSATRINYNNTVNGILVLENESIYFRLVCSIILRYIKDTTIPEEKHDKDVDYEDYGVCGTYTLWLRQKKKLPCAIRTKTTSPKY